MYWNQPTSGIKRCISGILLCFCFLCSYGCSIPNLDLSSKSLPSLDIDLPLIGEDKHIQEVAPPEIFQTLKQDFSASQPKVSILEPKSGSTLDDSQVDVKIGLSNLKLFRDSELKMGPHIALILDDRDPIELYSLDSPVALKNLEPGTHTLRAIAEYPWNESFKNSDAYDQVSFDILTPSRRNAVQNNPVLSISPIQDRYSAEPMLLDFTVRQAKTEADTNNVSTQVAQNLQIQATLNDQEFTIPDSEASIYIEGLKEGTNWLKLELQDSKGNFKAIPFSEQTYQFEFDPDEHESLGDITTGVINLQNAGVIVGRAKPTPPKPKTVPAKPSNASPTQTSNPSKPPKPESPKPLTSPKPSSSQSIKVEPKGTTSTSVKPELPKKDAPDKTSPSSINPSSSSSPIYKEKKDTANTAKPLPKSRFKTNSTTPSSPNKATGSDTLKNQTSSLEKSPSEKKPQISELSKAKPPTSRPLSSSTAGAKANDNASSKTLGNNGKSAPSIPETKETGKKAVGTPSLSATQSSAIKSKDETSSASSPSSSKDPGQAIQDWSQKTQNKIGKNFKNWRDRFQSKAPVTQEVKTPEKTTSSSTEKGAKADSSTSQTESSTPKTPTSTP